MSVSKTVGMIILAGVIGFCGFKLADRLSISEAQGLISTAEAKVGRPLTPVSVAGVARRTARRCANGTYNC